MIKELTIKNFKAFKSESIPFSDLTLLAGVNGMGKSTILQSLLLLRQSYLKGYLPLNGLALNEDLVRIGTAWDALHEGADEDSISFGIASSEGNEAEWVFRYSAEDPYPQREVLDLLSSPAPDFVKAWPLFTDACLYLQAERLGPRSAFAMSDDAVRQHRQVGRSGEFAVHFLAVYGTEVLSKNNSRSHRDAKSLELLAQVTAWMGEVSPGTKLDLIQHREIDRVALQYASSSGRHVGNSYRATNFGFGLTYTLPVVVALLSARPGSIVLLENPEAHLHPEGQAKMGELIARAAADRVQVVVETHSDHVLNGIRLSVYRGLLSPSQVMMHFVHRPDSHDERPPRSEVITPKMDTNGRLDHWPEGFFDQWGKSLRALLEPRDGGHKA